MIKGLIVPMMKEPSNDDPVKNIAQLNDEECFTFLIDQVARARMVEGEPEMLARYRAKVSPDILAMEASHVRKLLVLSAEMAIPISMVVTEFQKFVEEAEKGIEKSKKGEEVYEIKE